MPRRTCCWPRPPPMPQSAARRALPPSPSDGEALTPYRSTSAGHERADAHALARLPPPHARRPARRRLVTSAGCRRSRAAPRLLRKTASRRRRRGRPRTASALTASGWSSSAHLLLPAERGIPHGDRVLRTNPRSAGSSTNGPAYFVVEGLDGRIYEYGATADSSIDGRATPPAGGARTWALNRIRDRSGNVIDYRYTEESGSTAFRIATIRYNANPSRRRRGLARDHVHIRGRAPARKSTPASSPACPCARCAALAHRRALRRQVLRRYAPRVRARALIRRPQPPRLGPRMRRGRQRLPWRRRYFEWQDGDSRHVRLVAAFTAVPAGDDAVPAGGPLESRGHRRRRSHTTTCSPAARRCPPPRFAIG